MDDIVSAKNAYTFHAKTPLILESGAALQDLKIRYHTYGTLNEDKSNVVWIFHALTANSDPLEWWPGVVGKDEVITPENHYIICANMLGSCYGTTEPSDFNFPQITVKDMVSAHQLLKNELGIQSIKVGIGGSMGGQQLLQWAVEEPDLFETIVPIATNAKHTAWGIAFNEAQRMAINSAESLEDGLQAARAIAMLSYRNHETYNATQTDKDDRLDDYSAASYQRYQGKKLADRFSPYSYHYLSKAMDSHNIGREKGGVENALATIRSKAVVIGIASDLLFPSKDQHYIAQHIPNATFHMIESLYGHDGFLIEKEKLSALLETIL